MTFVVLLAILAQADDRVTTGQLVARVKTIDVCTLDKSLASQPLEGWLRAIPGVDSIDWTSAICGTSGGGPCIRVGVRVKGATIGSVMIATGGKTSHVTSARLLWYEVPPLIHGARLAELPDLVARHVRAMDYAKLVDVSRLDKHLTAQPLDHWLRHGTPHFESVVWSLSDCDLKDDPALPLCARFVFKRGQLSGFGLIGIGTIREGIGGVPQFRSALIARGRGAAFQGEIVNDLSDLARSVAK